MLARAASLDSDYGQLRAILREVSQRAQFQPSEPSWWERMQKTVLEFLGELLASLFGSSAAAGLPWFVFALALVVLAVLAFGFVRRMRHRPARHSDRAQRADASAEHTFTAHASMAAARRAARAGRFAEAFGCLYTATLQALDQLGEIELREQKTPGDYTRELRARRAEAFAELVRGIDPVLWGARAADLEQFEQLTGLARELGVAE